MMEVKVVCPVLDVFGNIKPDKKAKKVKLPIHFKVQHKNSGRRYDVYYFENLDLLVKISNCTNTNDSDIHPPFDSFKPISKHVFNAILNSDVFEVV
jgi:hypothetical protein